MHAASRQTVSDLPYADSLTPPGLTLRGVRLQQTTMQQVDFRGAEALEIADGYDCLRGAVIDSGQLVEIAPALAATLGISVDDG